MTRLFLSDGNIIDTETPLVEIGATGARLELHRDTNTGMHVVVNLDHLVFACDMDEEEDG